MCFNILDKRLFRIAGAIILFILILAAPASSIAQQQEGESDDIARFILGGDSNEVLSLYHLNYMILGSETAKMQLSVKCRPIEEIPFYLTYSNIFLWDIFESSSPYKDINFMLEGFYRFYPNAEWLRAVDVGYWHNSNGKDEEDSRAWDRIYLRINNDFDCNYFRLDIRLNAYANVKTGSQNGDISDYVGFWDTTLAFRQLLGKSSRNLDLFWTFRSGDHGALFDRGSQTYGLTYALTSKRIRPYIYLEYFQGYAEAMMDYDKSSSELRGGFAFYY